MPPASLGLDAFFVFYGLWRHPFHVLNFLGFRRKTRETRALEWLGSQSINITEFQYWRRGGFFSGFLQENSLQLQSGTLRTEYFYFLCHVVSINRWSLGDFTKMEGTQMKMFNFLWLILGHYLPLTPTKNNWPTWHPQGGCKFNQKANLLGKTMSTKIPCHL